MPLIVTVALYTIVSDTRCDKFFFVLMSGWTCKPPHLPTIRIKEHLPYWFSCYVFCCCIFCVFCFVTVQSVFFQYQPSDWL